MKEQGTVKWFNNDKGYGFISPAFGDDVFVYHSAIQANGYKSFNEGDSVEFSITKGPKRPSIDRSSETLVSRYSV